MKSKIIFIFIISLVLTHACKNPNENSGTLSTIIKPIVIDILPFDDIPENHTTFVYNELRKIYPNIIIKKSIPLPSSAYYNKRNRYRADSLIRFLRRLTPNEHVTIGLTTKDISTTKGKIEDYGVMGLGYKPGPSCVVSTFRLSKENRMNQFFKFCIHELGHTAGLAHCPEKTCFMRDAEGKNPTNEETDFCIKCKTHLISKGWNLKNEPSFANIH